MGDSAMALGLYYRDSFDLDVEFPSGAVRRFLFPARFTVDQVKSHIFRTVDAVDEGLAADGKTKFDWVFEVFEIGDLLTVEFQRFMYSHIEIELLMRNDEVPRVKFVPRLKGKIVGVARSLSRGTRGGIAADAMELADNLAALVNEDWDDDVTDASIPPSVLMEAGRGAGGEPAAADDEVLSAVPPGSAAGAEAAGGGGAETRRRNRLDTGEVRKEKARHKEELKAMKETLYAELEEIKRLHDETMSKPIGLPRPTGAPMVTVTPTPTVNNAHLAVVQQSDPGSHSAPDARASHTAAVAARETEASSSSRPSSPAPTPTAVPSALSPAAKDKGKKKKRLSLFGFGKGKAKDKDKGSQSDNPGSVEAGDGVGASSSSSVAAAAAAAAAPTAAAAEAEADQAPIEHASMVLRERTRRAMSVRHRKPDAPARESKRLTHRRFSWSSSQREAARATLGGTGASAMGGSTAGIPHFGVLCETEILELLEATQGSAPVFTVDDGPVIITPVKGWTIHGTSPTHSVESANASLDMREVDSDCTWYRDFFVGKDHINYVGQTKDDGPVVISIIREGTSKEMSYRVLFRSKNGLEKKVVPGSELKAGRLRSKPSAKEIVKQIYPAIASHVKVINDDALEGELQTMEERQLIKSYKVGLVYAKQGQTIEEDMFANDGAVIDHSPEYDEFLNWIGDVIELRGWDKYRAGLDVRGDTYGTHSVYTTWREFEVMFHVSTFLPYRANDYQQLQRKRHIGNDICVIIFMDGETPYAPDTIASQFNHVLLVVQPVPKSETGGATFYRMRMCYKDDVLPFGPPFPKQAMFEKNDALRDYIFGKLINGERHAYEAQGFKPAIVRTQTLLLKNIVETFAGGKN